MRCFVGSDETAVAGQVRELFIELGHACPVANVQPLDRVWASLSKGGAATASPELSAAKTTGAEVSVARPAAAEVEIVVVVLAPDPERALTAVRNNRRQTSARILLVGPTADTKLVLRGLREGANEFLDQADLRGELPAALQRLSAVSPKGRLIVAISASGGCGCSTIAANLAVALAGTHGSSAILDLNLEAGDLVTLLDLKPSYSIAELCQNVRRLDASLLEGCLVPHSSGVQLLAAPTRVADSIHVTPEGINEVLSLVAHRFPFVIVDLGDSFRFERKSLLLDADLILLALRLDFTCLRNTRAALEYLRDIGVSPDRVQIVVNRFGQPNEIAAAAAEEALGVKISHYLPDEAKTVNRANNNGVPVLLQSPSAKVSRRIAELAAHVAEEHPRFP
jgi:pilus assembly protein CpaE